MSQKEQLINQNISNFSQNSSWISECFQGANEILNDNEQLFQLVENLQFVNSECALKIHRYEQCQDQIIEYLKQKDPELAKRIVLLIKNQSSDYQKEFEIKEVSMSIEEQDMTPFKDQFLHQKQSEKNQVKQNLDQKLNEEISSKTKDSEDLTWGQIQIALAGEDDQQILGNQYYQKNINIEEFGEKDIDLEIAERIVKLNQVFLVLRNYEQLLKNQELLQLEQSFIQQDQKVKQRLPTYQGGGGHCFLTTDNVNRSTILNDDSLDQEINELFREQKQNFGFEKTSAEKNQKYLENQEYLYTNPNNNNNNYNAKNLNLNFSSQTRCSSERNEIQIQRENLNIIDEFQIPEQEKEQEVSLDLSEMFENVQNEEFFQENFNKDQLNLTREEKGIQTDNNSYILKEFEKSLQNISIKQNSNFNLKESSEKPKQQNQKKKVSSINVLISLGYIISLSYVVHSIIYVFF